MFTTYIIRGVKDGTFYTGLTDNFDRRFSEHNSGKENPTRSHRPYEVYLTRDFKTRAEARKLEKKLKSGYIREIRQNLVKLQEVINKFMGG